MLSRRLALAAAFAASGLLLAAGDARADAVGKVTSATGDVMVGKAKAAAGGAINGGDEIATAKGAEATLTLKDGSVLKVGGEAKLAISEKPSAKKADAMGKGTTRTIKIATGNVDADIKPGTDTYTEFDTPSGITAVRGTTLTITVSSSGEATVRCGDGVVHVIPSMKGAEGIGSAGIVTLTNGQQIKVTAVVAVGGGFQATVEVLNDGGKPIVAKVGNHEVKMSTGTAVKASQTTVLNRFGATTLSVTQGTAQVTDTTTNTTQTLAVGGSVETFTMDRTTVQQMQQGLTVTAEVESRPAVTDTTDVSSVQGE